MVRAAELDELFARLANSAFRQRFKLAARERDYIRTKGRDTILAHARDFVAQRLAPAHPPKDGRQTPLRGHPVFVAQHATATCCRSCLSKWHDIPADRPMSAEEQSQVVAVIDRWLAMQGAADRSGAQQSLPLL
ncbi:DUF4186 domain-containing protein [Belnapia sp. T6]|uniref:DUF4186 domain-containing protein n=1 Tax=Belnapia mucosa TaxID=2804532 RepID=A0ABS1UXE4_9PROT|nr:DUF4186 domain-containing protein [Belnapia mucosa]MBL6454070.1 DUF4186 domain-containing protein [Belnapia mucosa]